MRLDPDLVRAILLEVEAAPANRQPDKIDVDGYSDDEVLEHIELLKEAGYLDARTMRASTGGGRIMAAWVERLTWSGHEFLNDARDDTRWKQAKTIAGK